MRYNPEAKFLNLEVSQHGSVSYTFLTICAQRMSDDAVLKKNNITPPGVPGSSPREMAVIFKLASQLKPAVRCHIPNFTTTFKLCVQVETISLAHNNFTSGLMLNSLSHYLPKLRNLSLQGNGLKQWRDLDFLSGRKQKLQNLRELIMIDNPLRDVELKHNRGDNYQRSVQYYKTLSNVLIMWQ